MPLADSYSFFIFNFHQKFCHAFFGQVVAHLLVPIVPMFSEVICGIVVGVLLLLSSLVACAAKGS